jgi:hypothetical protein
MLMMQQQAATREQHVMMSLHALKAAYFGAMVAAAVCTMQCH